MTERSVEMSSLETCSENKMTPTSQDISRFNYESLVNKMFSGNVDLPKVDLNSPNLSVKDIEREITRVLNIGEEAAKLALTTIDFGLLHRIRDWLIQIISRVNACPILDDLPKSRIIMFLEAKNNYMRPMIDLLKVLDSEIEKQEVITPENCELMAAAANVITVLSCDSERFGFYKNRHPFDIMIRREAQDPHNNTLPLVVTEFYFDKVNLPTWLLSPELMTVISNRVLMRELHNGNYVTKLRPEYASDRYLAPAGTPHLDPKMCIPLSDELLMCCIKFIDKKYKYAPLGNSECESIEQQMENFMISGRADRIVSDGTTGPGPEHTANVILKENNKSISTRRVLIGSFPLQKSDTTSLDMRPNSKRRWIRVIVD